MILKLTLTICGIALGACLSLPTANAAPRDLWLAPDEAAKKTNPLPESSDVLAAGKKIYGQRCADCHGESGNADGPDAAELAIEPAKLSDPKVAEQSDGAWYWKIETGRKPMPRYGSRLTAEQIWQVIRYVRTLSKKEPNK